MKRLNPRQRLLLALWSGVSMPFVIMGLFCGCGTLMDNHAPPVAKQVLQGVDVVGSVVIGAATSPIWVPIAIGMDRDIKKQNAKREAGQVETVPKEGADTKTATETKRSKAP